MGNQPQGQQPAGATAVADSKPSPTNLSPAGVATPQGNQAKQYSQEEYSKMQSTLRSEAQTYKDRIVSLEAEVRKLHTEKTVLETEVKKPYTTDELRSSADEIRKAKVEAKSQVDERDKVIKEYIGKEKQTWSAKLLAWASTQNISLDEGALSKFETQKDMNDYVMTQMVLQGKAIVPMQEGSAEGGQPPAEPAPATLPLPGVPPAGVIGASWRQASPYEQIKAGVKELPANPKVKR